MLTATTMTEPEQAAPREHYDLEDRVPGMLLYSGKQSIFGSTGCLEQGLL